MRVLQRIGRPFLVMAPGWGPLSAGPRETLLGVWGQAGHDDAPPLVSSFLQAVREPLKAIRDETADSVEPGLVLVPGDESGTAPGRERSLEMPQVGQCGLKLSDEDAAWGRGPLFPGFQHHLEEQVPKPAHASVGAGVREENGEDLPEGRRVFEPFRAENRRGYGSAWEAEGVKRAR
jgi:hypothetical protein